MNSRTKSIFIILTLCFYLFSQAQYRERFNKYNYIFLQQSDSIYKSNKVKNRTTYFTGYGDNSIKHIFEFQPDGKVKSIFYPVETIWLTNIFFKYDEKGILIEAKEIYTKNNNSKYYKNFIEGDKDLEIKYRSYPNTETVNYKLLYTASDLSKVIRIDEKGKMLSESTFSQNGSVQSFKENSDYPLNFECKFQSDRNLQLLPLSFSYKKSSDINKDEFEYIFDDENHKLIGFIKKSIIYFNNKALEPDFEEFSVLYNEKGLITSIQSKGKIYEYHYEYY